MNTWIAIMMLIGVPTFVLASIKSEENKEAGLAIVFVIVAFLCAWVFVEWVKAETRKKGK